MRRRSVLLVPLVLLAAWGCGSGGSRVSTSSPDIVISGSPALQQLTGRSYRVRDLGKIIYNWPGWLLAPGAGSIALNENGDVISVYTNPPAVWTTTALTKLDNRFLSARGLNNRGQVVGDTWPSDRPQQTPTHAAIWQNGAVTDLGTLFKDPYPYNYVFSAALGINEAGQVVGESEFRMYVGGVYQRTHAISYANGTLYDLGSLGGTFCRAVAVNNTGLAIGYGTTAMDEQTHAIAWQNGTHKDLGTLPGGTYSQANALNDAGVAVGFSNRPSADLSGVTAPRAVVWQNGTIADLGTLGGPGSYATGINRSGVIVGSAETAAVRSSDIQTVGYYYDYFTYYGYGLRLGINSANYGLTGGNVATSAIAGGSHARAAQSRAGADPGSYYVAHAFAAADGTMLDLNRLLPSNSGWELTQAHAINAKGQIAGIGTLNGQVHGFFLDPQ